MMIRTMTDHELSPPPCSLQGAELLYVRTAKCVKRSLLTAVVHPVEPQSVHLTEVQVLANDVDELWDFGGDGGGARVLVEGKGPVMHDGLVVICCVLICDVVFVVFVEVVLHAWGRGGHSVSQPASTTLDVPKPKKLRIPAPSLIYSGSMLKMNTLTHCLGILVTNIPPEGKFHSINDKLMTNERSHYTHCTWCNLIQPDVHVVIPVCAGLFVVKAHGVK